MGTQKLSQPHIQLLLKGRKCSHLVSVFSLPVVLGHIPRQNYLGHSSCFTTIWALVWWALDLDASGHNWGVDRRSYTWREKPMLLILQFTQLSLVPNNSFLSPLSKVVPGPHLSWTSNPGLVTNYAVPWPMYQRAAGDSGLVPYAPPCFALNPAVTTSSPSCICSFSFYQYYIF